jgi:hypothetical protein
MEIGVQTHLIQLDPDLARRIRRFLSHSAAYRDLSELATVAIENQLALDSRADVDGGAEATADAAATRLEPAREDIGPLQRPVESPGLVNAPPVQVALYSLTNRLFPIKVATRVLAHASAEDASLATYHQVAGRAARALGLRLRAEDIAGERKGFDRRWVALPVGDDEQATLSRFVNHFTLVIETDGSAGGPLAQLGLGSLDETGMPRLTELGWELALTENPVLDLGSSQLLSSRDRELLISAITRNEPELAAIREFVGLVNDCSGTQPDVDRGLVALHPGWSDSQAVAHRASILGRLRDLTLASVAGRGPTAKIAVAEDFDAFWEN